MSNLQIGIVGYGKIARDQHEPAIAALDAAELVAIADPVGQHDNLPSFPSLADMIAAMPDIQAVAICTPPAHRSSNCMAALFAGLHVMLEKPPFLDLDEARQAQRLADKTGSTLITAWHSQEASAVDAARRWLSGRAVLSVKVCWKEDVRVWHPGQDWIWQAGGFGVFDPGINALSILTRLFPGQLSFVSSELEIPAHRETPIAARLDMASSDGFRVLAEFDFRQEGPQSWDIAIATDTGELTISHGGNRLSIDGVAIELPPEREYPGLYRHFLSCIETGTSHCDVEPLALTLSAISRGAVATCEPFNW